MANIPITVLMPVYNAEDYLERTINSILEQTFQDFEFLIIDDGSTDKSPDILKSFKDPRISIIHQDNKGIASALHLGIQLANGEYIARMDNDDESLPYRLEVQKAVLDKNLEVSLVYGLHDVIDKQGHLIRRRQGLGFSPIITKWLLIWSNYLTHPTVMIRTKFLREHNLNYHPQKSGAEDYDFWNRLIWISDFFFIPQVLLRYRVHEKSMCRDNSDNKRFDLYAGVILENFERYGIKISKEIAEELAVISSGTGVNPLTYPYQYLPDCLSNLMKDLSSKFIGLMLIQPNELFPVQAKQMIRWARYLLHVSKKCSTHLLTMSFRLHKSILFSRYFFLTVIALLLPKKALSWINKKRTRSLI